MHVSLHRPSQKSLAAFVDAFAVEKRVLVVGDASDSLGSWLLELGARGVEVWDPDDERALAASKAAPRGLVVRPLPRDAADVRAPGFDLAVITDLGMLEDVEQWVRWIRRWVGELGLAVFSAPCGPPPEHFEYYELYEIIAGQFANVRMVGQLPFSGVAFAEFGVPEDSIAVTVDGQLADGRGVPEAFLAVASQRIVAIDPYLIVELTPPGTRVAAVPDTAPDAAQPDVSRELRQALDEKAAEVAKLANELDARKAEAETLASDLATARAALDKAQAHARAESERVDLPLLVRRAEAAERQLAAVRSELARAIEIQAAEVTRYEAALSERAKTIRSLELDIAQRDQMIRELVDDVEEGSAASEPAAGTVTPAAAPVLSGDGAQLRARLEAMALEIARREGEAQASAWKVSELEQALAELRESRHP
jgi:hypothetical protein